jgi:hypothetical protein
VGVDLVMGLPRANAREEEEVVIPGGGGVGYDKEGAVRWRIDCARAPVWYVDVVAVGGTQCVGGT